MKKTGLYAAALAVMLLTGCQPTPETEAVTSKNDGTFEAALQATAKPDSADAAAQMYADSFTSTDGTATYTLALEVPAADGALPVLRVTPEAISSDTAERMARAVFGDADIYEYSAEKTKTELEDAILALKREISDRDALEKQYDEAGFGDEADRQRVVDGWVEAYERQMEEYEAAYEAAPETADVPLCSFTFHSPDYYEPDLGEESYAGWDVYEVIRATSETGGLPYELLAENLCEGDFQYYHVNIYCQASTEEKYELLRQTAEPSQADMDAAAERALALIASMDFGEWAVDSWEVYAYDLAEYGHAGQTGYILTVGASPVYGGLAVTNHLTVTGGEETATDSYAAVYDAQRITVGYIGKTLHSVDYTGPVAVTEETNTNVRTLSLDTIVEKVQDSLSLRGAKYYTTHTVDGCRFRQTGTASVTVDCAVLGLSRVRMKNSAGDYYLVPSYTFYGSIAMFDSDGNRLPYYNESDGSETVAALATEFVTVNAVDGTVIAPLQ